jgi:hypothetical protein
MAEELGRIEKPSVEGYKKGRKLYFVPLIYQGDEAPEEYTEKYERFWKQVADQLADLESKLGSINRIYHELIYLTGETGLKAIEGLNAKSYEIVKGLQDKAAQLEATENEDILTEFMDWNRCLLMGLQNEGVLKRVYEAYTDSAKKRNEAIKNRIDETLKEDETGILMMREGHQVQFSPDIQVIHVVPPALDEIKRWLRELESKAEKEAQEKQDSI